MKKAYLAEVGHKRRASEGLSVKKLNPVQRGHTLLLREQIDETMRRYFLKVKECGGIVNTPITIAGATAVKESF